MKKPLTLSLKKWAIWIACIAVVVLLRHLFPVIFLTFVLTYIGNTLVNQMSRRWPKRRVNLVLVYVLFLLILAGVSVVVIPRMFGEARQLAAFYVARDAVKVPGPGGVVAPPPEASEGTLLDRQARKYVDSLLVGVFGADTFRSFEQSDAYDALMTRVEASLRDSVPRVVAAVKEFVNASIAIVFQFLLSIILSFLILWDLPSLKKGTESLAKGAASEVYEEIAPGMTAFGVMLGRAFEAQTGIAVVNALLTSIGFLILGIPSIALLATIVFFCSYVPVVGVILSTVPAALFAFKSGGIALVGWLIVVVLVVHAVEAYLLNPIIYGHHLKMHPVAILVILLVGEHLLGVWGLILGVPIAAFIWSYVIAGRPVSERPKPLPATGVTLKDGAPLT